MGTQNDVRASNLILIAAALVAGRFFAATGGNFALSGELAEMLIRVTVLFVVALLIRKGYWWAKFFFSVSVIAELYTTITVLSALFKVNLPAACLSVLLNLLLVIAAILLIFFSKKQVINPDETTII